MFVQLDFPFTILEIFESCFNCLDFISTIPEILRNYNTCFSLIHVIHTMILEINCISFNIVYQLPDEEGPAGGWKPKTLDPRGNYYVLK